MRSEFVTADCRATLIRSVPLPSCSLLSNPFPAYLHQGRHKVFTGMRELCGSQHKLASGLLCGPVHMQEHKGLAHALELQLHGVCEG